MENSDKFYFLSLPSHYGWWLQDKIKTHLLHGRKAMTNLDSVLKSRDITLLTKVHIVKAMVFPVVMNEYESWAINKAECWRTVFLNCSAGEYYWESLVLKKGQTNHPQRKSTLNINWKDWCWSWSSSTLANLCEEPTIWKRPLCCERLKVKGEEATENKMVR